MQSDSIRRAVADAAGAELPVRAGARASGWARVVHRDDCGSEDRRRFRPACARGLTGDAAVLYVALAT